MTWLLSHRESERIAAQAHEAFREGERDRAKILFGAAGEAEAVALSKLGQDKPRTLGITAASAAALLYKSGNFDRAEQFAHAASAMPLPSFARLQIRELLQSIWNERAQAEAGLSFMPGQVLVSIRGGNIVTGGAPLDLIVSKVQAVQSMFYRTAEMLLNLPLRLKGPPSRNIQERCKPWLFQSVPGSYQFAVAIQKPLQEELFPTEEIEPEVLTDTFLRILGAASDETEELRTFVPQDDYRQTFLKMARNLAPTGKTFEQMEVRSTAGPRSVVLGQEARKRIVESIQHKEPLASSDESVVLHGNLRAVDLDQDWLQVLVDGEIKKIWKLSEAVDDLIGPMVNNDVIVTVKQTKRSGKLTYEFFDIEADD